MLHALVAAAIDSDDVTAQLGFSTSGSEEEQAEEPAATVATKPAGPSKGVSSAKRLFKAGRLRYRTAVQREVLEQTVCPRIPMTCSCARSLRERVIFAGP